MSQKIWKIKLDQTEHEIFFNRALILGHNSIMVDGTDIPLPDNLYATYIGYDQPFMIGEKECRLVSLGNWADIVVEGRYEKSGKPYLPFDELQWWSWVFVSLCALVIVYSAGGLLPVVSALLGVMYCLQVSVRPEFSLLMKLSFNILISALVWLVTILIMNIF